MSTKTKRRPRARKMSDADWIVAEAKRRFKTRAEQLEMVRWWRDVNGRNDFRFQMQCAIAIDKLKGLY